MKLAVNCGKKANFAAAKKTTMTAQFRNQGQVCQLIGPLMPPTDSEPTLKGNKMLWPTAENLADQIYS